MSGPPVAPRHRPPAAEAILLIGTVGTGKTTVLLALGEELAARGEPHALLDLDWLCWATPDPAANVAPGGLMIANLDAVCSVYARAGIRRLVLSRHLRERGELDAVRAILAPAELHVVRLEVAAAELERRLRARDRGAELAEHLGELRRFERRPADDELADDVVPNAGRTPRETALAVLAVAGW